MMFKRQNNMCNRQAKTSFVCLPMASIFFSCILTGCWSNYVNSDVREANNNFRYLDEVAIERNLVQPQGTDPINYSNQFVLPKIAQDNVRSALVGRAVDVRPPQKLIPLNSNIAVNQDGDISYVWFYPDEEGHEMTSNDLLETLFRMFKRSSISVDEIDAVNSVIRTDWYDGTEFATPYTPDSLEKDLLIYRQKYAFGLRKNTEGALGVSVQLTDNIIEQPDGGELKAGLNRYEPSRFTALMANRLMWFYNLDMKTKHTNEESSYVGIVLGKDNNALPCWIVDASFNDTYKALEQLMLKYEIQIKEYSSTTGQIKIKYDEPDPEFWTEHNTESWALESGKYTFKLGIYQGKTSITLYDSDDKPVSTGVTARMYSGFATSLNHEFYVERTGK